MAFCDFFSLWVFDRRFRDFPEGDCEQILWMPCMPSMLGFFTSTFLLA